MENDESMVLIKTDQGYMYNRAFLEAEDLKNLSQKMDSRYKAKTLLTSSGMNAISVTINSILINYSINNLIYGNELYCDTPRLFKYLKNIYKINICEIDVLDSNYLTDMFKTKFKNQNNVLFIEACSNPSGHIFDMELIKILRHNSKKLIVVVDNTWLSSAIYNPLDWGADIVVTSLTKYYSGGTHIGGAIMTRDKIYNKIYEYIRYNGLHMSPLQCKIIAKNIDTLEERIIKSSKLTVEIADFLKSHKNVIKVSHPSLNDHESFRVGTKIFKDMYPSVLTFTIKQSEKLGKELMIKSGIDYKTSFGSDCSRLDPWPTIIDDQFLCCRLALGYNDNYSSLVKKLQRILG